MATYLHVTPALALAVVIGPQRVPWPWWLVGALVAEAAARRAAVPALAPGAHGGCAAVWR